MKVIADRMELLALCKRAARLASEAAPMDELKGILLNADAATGQISVSATNMEVSLRSQMKAEVRESGSWIINARLCVGMLSQLPGKVIAMYGQTTNSTLLVAGGQAKYSVSVMPGRRYPPIELPFPDDTVQVSGVPAMSRRTAFAASEDKTRATMQCVNLVFSEDGLKAVSSDGSRIMSAKGDVKGAGAVSMLIPARSLALLAGICTDADIFLVGTTGRNIVFLKEGFIFSARTIDGEYVNTDALFGAYQPQFTVLTDGEALYRALDSVATLGDSSSVVALSFTPDAIELSCTSDSGTARGSLDTIPLTGTPCGQYHYGTEKLKECLRAMGGTMQLKVAQNGALLLGTEQVSCLTLARRAPASARKTKEKAA